MRVVRKVDGVYRCQACGVAMPDQARPHLGRCECSPPPPPRGLGDVVADTLSAVGITKRRVSRLLGRPCGCKKRQAWLNRIVPAVPGLSRRPH